MKITSGVKLKNKIVCIAKYNKLLSYKPIILFYKVALKDDYFTFENVYNEVANNFLFERKDIKGNIVVDEVDYDSFKNAFETVDFEKLKNYQQKIFDDLLEILK